MNPRQAIKTERLVLTPVGPADRKDLTLLYADPLVAQWTGPWTPAEVAAWTAAMAQRWAVDGVGKWMARDRIVAFTEVHNRASRAVMERLGMQPAGVIRREGLIEGRTGLHPDAPFALYRIAVQRM